MEEPTTNSVNDPTVSITPSSESPPAPIVNAPREYVDNPAKPHPTSVAQIEVTPPEPQADSHESPEPSES
jgi:hypothetical protein